jgi:hypothetical protein
LPTRAASKQTQRAAYNNCTDEISNAIHVLVFVSCQQGLYYYSIYAYMSRKLKWITNLGTLTYLQCHLTNIVGLHLIKIRSCQTYNNFTLRLAYHPSLLISYLQCLRAQHMVLTICS